MGEMEKQARTRMRMTKIRSAIIGTVAIAGIVAIGAMAPNAMGVIAKSKYFRQGKYRFKSSFSRLISEDFLSIVEKNGKRYVRLTDKGEKYAALIGEGRLKPKKPKRWDGKWRILIFDIPEKRRRVRDTIRTTLISIGFVRLQDSVWVYPYDCEDLITLLKADLRIGKDVLYIIAVTIEYDAPLRRRFNLA